LCGPEYAVVPEPDADRWRKGYLQQWRISEQEFLKARAARVTDRDKIIDKMSPKSPYAPGDENDDDDGDLYNEDSERFSEDSPAFSHLGAALECSDQGMQRNHLRAARTAIDRHLAKADAGPELGASIELPGGAAIAILRFCRARE
jgi:hypothetical protein